MLAGQSGARLCQQRHLETDAPETARNILIHAQMEAEERYLAED